MRLLILRWKSKYFNTFLDEIRSNYESGIMLGILMLSFSL
jgi:hypothetical protein